jgi:hypothetical protein
LQSDLRPSQISNVDVLLIDRADVNNTKFMILTDFPDRLDLVEGVKLTVFGRLENNNDYDVVSRVFLNEAPNIIIPRIIIARALSPNLDVTIRAFAR